MSLLLIKPKNTSGIYPRSPNTNKAAAAQATSHSSNTITASPAPPPNHCIPYTNHALVTTPTPPERIIPTPFPRRRLPPLPRSLPPGAGERRRQRGLQLVQRRCEQCAFTRSNTTVRYTLDGCCCCCCCCCCICDEEGSTSDKTMKHVGTGT